MNNKPLLTIAIPTWNRAVLLRDALDALLSQINDNKNRGKIEIVISDNASTDNTNAVIEAFKSEYSTLNIAHFKQKENTGYFGNFQKCRELSTGNYFWLLSDNDHLANGLIAYLMNVLEDKDPSFVFLSDWKHTQRIKKQSSFAINEYSVKQAIELFHYRTTLISAVVFLNNKSKDEQLFDCFKGNTFIGFMYFLQSLDYNKTAIKIKGTSLYIKDTKVSFNAFKSFSVDLVSCVNFAVNQEVLSARLANILMNKVISELTVRHYILYRITGKLHGMNPGTRTEIDDMLRVGFKSYEAYEKELKPLQVVEGLRFFRRVISKHLVKIFWQKVTSK